VLPQETVVTIAKCVVRNQKIEKRIKSIEKQLSVDGCFLLILGAISRFPLYLFQFPRVKTRGNQKRMPL
jgi:hypothetical protein